MTESVAQGLTVLLRWRCAVYDCGMKGQGRAGRELRITLVSAMSVVLAPFVLMVLLLIRKVRPRVRFLFRGWNRRLQREIARWS
jgi:hypothetical protein